ncbi:MAG: DNA-3-methyladenine glycosylase I [Pseudomonadota bacterium]
MSERCPWCGTDPLYVAYHDAEWGVPERDPRALFEMLILEGFQAGLSWYTILKKRENFRARFAGFDPETLANWGEQEVLTCLDDPGIVRHRGKIEAAIKAGRAWLEIEAREGFADWIWRHVDGQPIQNHFRTMADVPAETAISKRLSKELKAAGFNYCGPTISYAFMQATGMVNDHLVGCPRHAALSG